MEAEDDNNYTEDPRNAKEDLERWADCVVVVG